MENIVIAASGAAFAVAVVATNLLKKRFGTASPALVTTHRNLPRPNRRTFDHARAYACIQQDYLGPDLTFNGANFVTTNAADDCTTFNTSMIRRHQLAVNAHCWIVLLCNGGTWVRWFINLGIWIIKFDNKFVIGTIILSNRIIVEIQS